MRRLDDEHGATVVFVAILLVVMFGMGALVIDVGHMFWERRQLQNGADAAALALASKCADDTIVDCANAAVSLLGNEAAPYADANADDDESGVPALMAHGTDPASCDPGSDDAPNPLTDGETIKVSTETIDASTGESFLSHWLAPVLGIDTTTVTACAVAAWGSAVAAEGFPFGVCEDLWQANRPSATEPGSTIDVRYKGTGQGEGAEPVENDCLDEEDDDFGPGNKPGNFSWLDQDDGECTTEFDFSDGDITASGDTGAAVPNDCQGEIDEMIAQIQAHKDANGNVVHLDPDDNDLPIRVLPIYSEVSGSGTNATYTVVTLGAFEFSGLKTSGNQNIVVDSWNEPLCERGGSGGNAHRCVQGRFVEEVTLDGEVDHGADSDVIVVELIE